jgi:hypothetical protein
MDDDRIDRIDPVDLSALDPARDPDRWNAMIAKTAARAAARREASLSRTLARWGAPAFVLAAAAAVTIWLLAPPRGVGGPGSEGPGRGEAYSSPSDGLVGWAMRGDADGAALMSSLGGAP